MNFSVACSWDDALLEGLAKIAKEHPHNQYELFGSLKQSFFGSAHSAASISGKCCNREEVEAYVKKIHALGFKFNYTLNAACLGNKEYTTGGRQSLMENLAWICSFSDAVTVAIPYLIEIIRKNFSVEIVASTITDINSVKRARFFESLGTDRITLSYMINRNFKLLEAIRSETSCKIEIMLNDSCLLHCPFRNYHYNLGSHASQLEDNFYMDYPVAKCLLERLKNPSEYIRSPWIRPEDLKHYKNFTNVFKIAGREKNSDWILNTVNAYTKETYAGNLLDLMTIISPSSHSLGKIWFKNLPKIHLDNQKLENFITKFLKQPCLTCSVCGYCQKWTDDVLTVEEKEQTIKEMEQLLDFILNFDSAKFKNLLPWVRKGVQLYLENNWQWKLLKPFASVFRKQLIK